MALFALFLTIFSIGSCSNQVPLVMWASDGYSLPSLPFQTAGHIMPSGQVVSYLNSALESAPGSVLLFLQDKMSKDDFTMYGGVFGNKQDSAFPNVEAALHSSSSSVVLPAISWTSVSAIPALLQEKLGVSPLLVDPDTLSHLQLNASGSNLLIINLPYNTESHTSCKQVLHSNDEIIGKVLSVMKFQNVPYTAIYTGLQPSRVIAQPSLSGQPLGRSLLQAVVDTVKPPIIFNNNEGRVCIMLWAQNLNVSFTTGTPAEWTDLATQTPTLVGSTCNGNNSRLVLNYGGGIVLSFAMSQRFYPVSARNWFVLDTVTLQSNGMSASFSGNRSIYAPAEYSFHCQSVNSFRDALLSPLLSTGEAAQWRLNFIDFQIQGFGLANGTNFSYASDCAGFFTAGIWMGLIVTLLMLWILTYGLHMIMQINTMDRFDDPKGPSISVPQSE
ncbi:V-type proton ATPase subunit S1b [Aplochiton taeniatus]